MYHRLILTQTVLISRKRSLSHNSVPRDANCAQQCILKSRRNFLTLRRLTARHSGERVQRKIDENEVLFSLNLQPQEGAPLKHRYTTQRDTHRETMLLYYVRPHS